MEILILLVLLGVIPAVIADRKGRNFGVWWLFGIFALIIAIPAALLVKPNEEAMLKRPSLGVRRCPHCAEMIKRQARVCRYCGRDLPPVDAELDVDPEFRRRDF